jgi:L-aminopeptidase/D-esterase-like protein
MAAPSSGPVPHVSGDGPALTFDFPGLQVGVAEYEEGPTGVTVLYFPKRVKAAVDVRGGAPGTVNSDALRLVHDSAFVSAVVLAGGSAYGLSAATGVANALKDSTPDPGDWRNVAVVAGAIIFDLGDRRYNAVTPDEALGRAALHSARAGWFPLGARGAGRFAMQGGYLGDRQHSGQGAALRSAGPTKVLVVTVVNAAGSVVDRKGNLLKCSPADQSGSCGSIAAALEEHLGQIGAAKVAINAAEHDGPTANTTVTVVITNQILPFAALQRLAIQVHNSMARAIQPFGSFVDGDTLFAVTTDEVANPQLNQLDLSTLASEAAWDAIIASAPTPAVAAAHGTQPAKTPEAYVGHYQLASDVTAELRRTGEELEIEVTGRDSLYLPAGKAVALAPSASDEFVLMTPRADRLRFDRDTRGRVAGFTINPGSWPVHAQRITRE